MNKDNNFKGEDFDFNEYLIEPEHEDQMGENYDDHWDELGEDMYYDEDVDPGEGQNNYIKDRLSEGKFGDIKRKFLDFKYNGGTSEKFDMHNNTFDEKKKMFLIMAGVSLLLLVVILLFVFTKK